jgi:hypothetical protein
LLLLREYDNSVVNPEQTTPSVVLLGRVTSSNLVDWLPVNAQLSISNNLIHFIDINATNDSQRFYRVIEDW